MNKKIGPFLLTGFMIGPILGSGIILLPPLAYAKIGTQSIWAWIIMMALGALFAMLFAKLSIVYPGDGGMTIAIEKAFGYKMKLFASLLLMSAVLFGPTAVMLTAAQYLSNLEMLKGIPLPFIAMTLSGGGFLILLGDIKFISTLSFVLSSVIALILLISGAYVILTGDLALSPIQGIEVIPFGRVVLLLFWAIIGWEIVGNYSEQVKDVKKTIPVATTVSVIIISVIYLVVAGAFQTFAPDAELSLVDVLYPLFGDNAVLLLVLLVTGLCFTTYLTIIGAVARLAHSLAVEGYLPVVFRRKNKYNIPYICVMSYGGIHLFVLFLSYMNLLDIEQIVSIANGFFLANALIGLGASMKIIKGIFYKVSGGVLIVSLVVILGFSDYKIYVALLVVLGLSLILSRRSKSHEKRRTQGN